MLILTNAPIYWESLAILQVKQLDWAYRMWSLMDVFIAKLCFNLPGQQSNQYPIHFSKVKCWVDSFSPSLNFLRPSNKLKFSLSYPFFTSNSTGWTDSNPILQGLRSLCPSLWESPSHICGTLLVIL